MPRILRSKQPSAKLDPFSRKAVFHNGEEYQAVEQLFDEMSLKVVHDSVIVFIISTAEQGIFPMV